MTDRKKIIKGLTDIYDEAYDRWVHCQYHRDKLLTLIAETIPDALDLLREQEPKSVKIKTNAYGIKHCYCPKCNEWFEKKEPYCHLCGQAVKWDD